MKILKTKQLIQTLGLILLSASIAEQASAICGGTLSGYVYTRALVTTEAGNYIWAVYDNETGAYIREIGEATGDLDPKQWQVMSGDEYQSYIDLYTKVKEDYNNDALLKSRADYQGESYKLADGKTDIAKPDLQSNTAHISLLPESMRLTQANNLVIREYPVDPTKTGNGLFNSMLVRNSGEGTIGEIKQQQEEGYIAFRNAFVRDRDGNVMDLTENTGSSSDELISRFGRRPIQPLAATQVEVLNRQTVTNEGGYYRSRVNMGDNTVTAVVRYQRFNPRQAQQSGRAYISRPTGLDCSLSSISTASSIKRLEASFSLIAQSSARIIKETGATTFEKLMNQSKIVSIPIDVMALSGTIAMPVPITEKTTYQAPSTIHTKVQNKKHDFDGDGTIDTTVIGHWENIDNKMTFVIDSSISTVIGHTQYQGVYLSSGTKSPNKQPADAPDFTRLLDYESYQNTADQGLLTEISLSDLQQTDIYVVRVSDGKLISERIGLHEREIGRITMGTSQENQNFFYSLKLLNRYTSSLHISQSVYKTYQSQYGINPDLHKRNADHLRPGDLIRIYAINRPTGYMGMAESKIIPNQGGGIGITMPPIQMAAPNLKIEAKRKFNVKAGLTKGEERNQTIGYEGAALTSDSLIEITTEWLDPNGRSLPRALEDAGYTGRLAALTESKTLPGNDTSGIYKFAIKPGKHLVVLQLPYGAFNYPQNYYIQVAGASIHGLSIFSNENSIRINQANFDNPGKNKRPHTYVPFQVPIYDEEASALQKQSYKQLKKDQPEVDWPQPKPLYQWAYRPEFQYSTYSFELEEMRAYQHVGEEIQIIDLKHLDYDPNPGDIISVIYDLGMTTLAPLDYYNAGPEQTLIFALGEQEIEATISEDGNIKFDDCIKQTGETSNTKDTLCFDNMEYLSLLDADDFITLRLYTNNDMGNTLWQWNFGRLYQVNLELYTPASIDPTEPLIADSEELAIGGMLFVNHDNDDQDNKFDFHEKNISGGDDDLAKLKIVIPSHYEGTAMLTKPGGYRDINLWKDKSKVKIAKAIMKVPDDFVEENGELVKTLWVEAIFDQRKQRQT